MSRNVATKPNVVLGYPNALSITGVFDEPLTLRSVHPEPAVRLIADAILGYFATSGPYSYALAEDEVVVDGPINPDELALYIARAIGERAS